MVSLLRDHHRVSEIDGAVLDSQDVPNVEMKGGDLRAFLNERELTFAGRYAPTFTQKNPTWGRSFGCMCRFIQASRNTCRTMSASRLAAQRTTMSACSQ